MPELPEVQTTVQGINDLIERSRHKKSTLIVSDIWTDYNSPFYHGSDTIKDPSYFTLFKKNVTGKSLVGAHRRAKNILIDLSGGVTILIHMKMTGHVLFGEYEFKSKNIWLPLDTTGPLADPFNRHIRLVFTLENQNGAPMGHLVLSDMRRFATVKLLTDEHLKHIGPEPLDRSFTFDIFIKQLRRKPKGKIKPTIMDQTIIAGIGNIYADESLWRAGIHPESRVRRIPSAAIKKLYDAIRATLSKGIDFGGDSMSDYRNIEGKRGAFQEEHRAYRKTGSHCTKAGCSGTIIRKVIIGRSGHFCDTHQRRF